MFYIKQYFLLLEILNPSPQISPGISKKVHVFLITMPVYCNMNCCLWFVIEYKILFSKVNLFCRIWYICLTKKKKRHFPVGYIPHIHFSSTGEKARNLWNLLKNNEESPKNRSLGPEIRNNMHISSMKTIQILLPACLNFTF